MAILCPECGEETGANVGVGTDGGSVVSRYRCENCEHEWFVPF